MKEDRRAGRAAPLWRIALLRLRGLLRRPIRLRRRGLDWRIELVDRRRRPSPFDPPTLEQARDELRVRLLAIDHEHAAVGMRQLVRVHEALKRGGLPAVQAMRSRELGRAHGQAQLLASIEPSPALALLMEQLKLAEAAAAAREERRAQGERESLASIEVRETSFDEFEQTDRVPLPEAVPPDPR